MKRAVLGTALCHLWSSPLCALDLLELGPQGQKWNKIRESSSFIAVAEDSIWIWEAQVGVNLAPQTLARKGGIYAEVIRPLGPGVLGPALAKKPGLESWIDGDAATAWDPEEDEELGRQPTLDLDLGATFRVNRIRLYPCLDEEHRGLILGSFDVGTSDGTIPAALTAEYRSLFSPRYTEIFPNRQPVVDRSFPSRDVRYVRISSQEKEAWEVEGVLVDDQPVMFTLEYQPGEGFTVDLWQRVVQAGSFVQIVFRAAVFRDGTPFLVRAVDLRPEEGGLETVYQTVREGDVDPFSVGGQLVVRFSSPSKGLVQALGKKPAVITPNGDGTNDFLALSYGLFMLIQPAPVTLSIFDLHGHRLRQDEVGTSLSGQYTGLWDGTDAQGRLVPPGIYLYRIEVNADTGHQSWQGTVKVVY